MTQRPSLGQVLRRYGRIDEEDQEAALAYQRSNGGYFGEALVALGRVTREELEFGLATQFDLPYVFPDPESVDRDAAEFVSPEWALTHLAIPIARTDVGLTVVVDSPMKVEPLAELERRTGLEVQLAIASPSKIRELIREVYDRGGTDPDAPASRPAMSLDEFLDLAVAERAVRFGISERGRRALGWWEERGTIHRRHLTSGWEDALERRLAPGPREWAGEASVPVWEARLAYRGTEMGVEVRSLRADRGRELLLRPTPDEGPLDDEFLPPPAGVVTEVRLLARSGVARFAVEADPPELGERILASLPSLLLGPTARAVHLVPEGAPAPSPLPASLVLETPSDPERREAFLRDLRGFRLDGVSSALPGDDPQGWLPGVAAAAAVVFVPMPPPGSRDPLPSWGVGWRLRLKEEEGGRLDWTIDPLSA